MKVLIIRFSSIGDIVLTTPVIRTLKQQTHAQIHYLTSARYKELLCANPYIDKLIAVEEGNTRQFVGELRKERYDYIIDLHHNMRTFILKRLLWRSKSYSFHKLNIKKLLLVFFEVESHAPYPCRRPLFTHRSAFGCGARRKGFGLFLARKRLCAFAVAAAFFSQGVCRVCRSGKISNQMPPYFPNDTPL